MVEYARRKKLYDPIAHALASTLTYEKSHFGARRPSPRPSRPLRTVPPG
ncbi:MAG: hypothetical protein IPI06_01810 [Gammaproteobacteria bacterium]|nr:hypothetical protein [Gammaproteobacteria bacterium]